VIVDKAGKVVIAAHNSALNGTDWNPAALVQDVLSTGIQNIHTNWFVWCLMIANFEVSHSSKGEFRNSETDRSTCNVSNAKSIITVIHCYYTTHYRERLHTQVRLLNITALHSLCTLSHNASFLSSFNALYVCRHYAGCS
jgi:hypothetical protein